MTSRAIWGGGSRFCDGRGGGRFLRCDEIKKSSSIYFFKCHPTTRATSLKISKDLNDAKGCV